MAARALASGQPRVAVGHVARPIQRAIGSRCRTISRLPETLSHPFRRVGGMSLLVDVRPVGELSRTPSVGWPV